MQNTYQEKIANSEVNNPKENRKLEGGIKFKIKSNFQPNGDQPEAIKKLLKNLKNNKQEQVLLGVTGSGKTFTMDYLKLDMLRLPCPHNQNQLSLRDLSSIPGFHNQILFHQSLMFDHLYYYDCH